VTNEHKIAKRFETVACINYYTIICTSDWSIFRYGNGDATSFTPAPLGTEPSNDFPSCRPVKDASILGLAIDRILACHLFGPAMYQP
jgi:hypothetical protein